MRKLLAASHSSHPCGPHTTKTLPCKKKCSNVAGRMVRQLSNSQLFFCSLAKLNHLCMLYRAFLKAVVMTLQQSQSCYIILITSFFLIANLLFLGPFWCYFLFSMSMEKLFPFTCVSLLYTEKSLSCPLWNIFCLD